MFYISIESFYIKQYIFYAIFVIIHIKSISYDMDFISYIFLKIFYTAEPLINRGILLMYAFLYANEIHLWIFSRIQLHKHE